MNLRQLPLTKLGEDNLHYNTAAAAIKSWPTANTVARATAFHKATTMQLDERRLHCGECDRSKPYEDAAWSGTFSGRRSQLEVGCKRCEARNEVRRLVAAAARGEKYCVSLGFETSPTNRPSFPKRQMPIRGARGGGIQVESIRCCNQSQTRF